MNPAYPPVVAVRDAVGRALGEDLLPLGDLTASLLPDGLLGRGAIVVRAPGVLAGRLCVDETYRSLDPDVELAWSADDGADVVPGQAVATIRGPLASILTGERTALNFLCHLSGVASSTRHFVLAVAGRATVWDTRKTLPGLRSLEKAAVRAGGGANHRGNLSEFVLVKDNHLVGLSITDAVRRAGERWPARTVEVECDRLEQVAEAVEAGCGLVLLDNMSPDQVREAVGLVAGRARTEVSGGVTLETVAAYADAGCDLISTSVITQSAVALDIGLDLSGAAEGADGADGAEPAAGAATVGTAEG